MPPLKQVNAGQLIALHRPLVGPAAQPAGPAREDGCPRSRRGPGAPTRSRSRSCRTTGRVGSGGRTRGGRLRRCRPLLRPREPTTITLAPRTATVGGRVRRAGGRRRPGRPRRGHRGRRRGRGGGPGGAPRVPRLQRHPPALVIGRSCRSTPSAWWRPPGPNRRPDCRTITVRAIRWSRGCWAGCSSGSRRTAARCTRPSRPASWSRSTGGAQAGRARPAGRGRRARAPAAFATGWVIGAPRPDGVVFETKSGPIVIMARAVVDATGDGDVAALAGAPFEVGREGDGLVAADDPHVPHGGVRADRLRGLPPGPPGPSGGRARSLGPGPRGDPRRGAEPGPRGHPLLRHPPRARAVRSTAPGSRRARHERLGPHAGGVAGAGARCTSSGPSSASTWPGFDRSYVVQSGVTIGVRETRRITGEYRLSADDILGARKWDDVIAARDVPAGHPQSPGQGHAADAPAARRVLRHPAPLSGAAAARPPHGGGTLHLRHPRGAFLVPRDAIAMATGQAAGVCAALAARAGKAVRDVTVGDVQGELRRQGAAL